MTPDEYKRLHDEADYVARNAEYLADHAAKLLELVQAIPEPAEPEPMPAPEPNPGLVIAAPSGPFESIDGGGSGRYYGAWELDRGDREIRSVHATNQTSIGVGAMNWTDGKAHPVDPPVIIEDCIVEDTSRPEPRSSNGTSEANYWIGCTTEARRLEGANGAWMGLWLGGMTDNPVGGCYRSIIEDLELWDQPHVGIYVEHTTTETTVRRFRVHAPRPINIEWWYGNNLGPSGCTFEDFELHPHASGYSAGYAIFVDAGNYGHTFRNGVIHGGGRIALPSNLVDPTQPNVVENVVDEHGQPVEIVHHNNPHDYHG